MKRARSSRHAACAALGAVALFAGACGEPDPLSRTEYEQKVQRPLVEIERGVSRLTIELRGVASGTASLEDASVEAEALLATANEATVELDAVTPPADVEEPHRRLVHGLRALAADIETFFRAIEERDVERVRVFARGLDSFSSVVAIERASRELERAGYDVDRP